MAEGQSGRWRERYLQINQRLTDICGISVEDHLGRSVRDCVPALADAVEGIVRSIMSSGESVAGIEVTSQRTDKTEDRWWVTYWHPLRDPKDEIIAVNVAAEEITERKRAEAVVLSRIDGGAVFFSGEALYRGRDMGTVEAALASGLATERTLLG